MISELHIIEFHNSFLILHLLNPEVAETSE